MPLSWVRVPAGTSRKLRDCVGDDKTGTSTNSASGASSSRAAAASSRSTGRRTASSSGCTSGGTSRAPASVIADLEATHELDLYDVDASTRSRRSSAKSRQGDRRGSARRGVTPTPAARQPGRSSERHDHAPLLGHRGVDAARQTSRRPLWCGPRDAPPPHARGVRAAPRGGGRHPGRRLLRRLQRAADAVAGAGDALRALAAHDWEGGAPLLARIGIHTGAPTLSDGGYYVGLDLTRGARICAAAHGGRCCSRARRGSSCRTRRGARSRRAPDEGPRDDGAACPAPRPRAPRRFSPPRARAPGNVPTPRLALVDRNRELGDLAELIRRDAALVTLTGAGGAGKTRLALEVARRVARSSSTARSSSGSQGSTTRRRFCPRSRGARRPRTAGRGARGRARPDYRRPRVVAPPGQLRACPCGGAARPSTARRVPRLAVLATSRELLRVRPRSSTRCRRFPTPTRATCLPRARPPSNPGPTSAAGRRPEVLAICSASTASRSRSSSPPRTPALLPLRTILERLEQRIAFLGDGRRGLPERQRTLRATIDWSYTLLDAGGAVVARAAERLRRRLGH